MSNGTDITTTAISTIERVLIQGDLAPLKPDERVQYYRQVCESVGLNPLTKPFEYITLNGKLQLYARKDCTDQLRKRDGVSIYDLKSAQVGDIYVVTASARNRDGREDCATGAVAIKGLSGDNLANALMKAECVPVSYQMLSREGFKFWHELREGELVAAYNHATDQIEWVPLQGTSVYQDREVREYGHSNVGFEITEGHTFATDHGVMPFEEIATNNGMILAAEERGDAEGLTRQQAALLGWVLTDAAITRYGGRVASFGVCQSKAENFAAIDDAFSCVGGPDRRACTSNRERGWMDQHWWYANKDKATQFFASVGCPDGQFECLPSVICSMSFSAREAMLDAMLRADGDARGTFGKGKRFVVEAVQLLACLNGVLTSPIRTRLFATSDVPFYTVRLYKHRRVFRQNLDCLGVRVCDVWCPTTAHGTWIAKTDDGAVLITGNTKSKRRVTLSLCGLGMLDETELETIHEPAPKAANGQGQGSALVFPRGKFKGMMPSQVPTEGREANYLDWYAANVLDGDDALYEAVQAEIRKRAGGEPPESGAAVAAGDGPGLPPGVEFNSWRDYMRDDPDRAMVLVQQMRGVSPSLYSDPAAQLSVMRACEAAMTTAGSPYEPIEATA